MRARHKGLRVTQWGCGLAVGTGERPDPPVWESSGGGVTPPPTRSLIFSGKRWRRSGGRVEAEPVAEPEVIARVVEELAAGLLRAGWLPLLVDVGPEQVLGAEERAGRELEHQELIRGCPAGEAGRPRERRQADAGRRAEQQRWGQVRLDAGPPGRR